MNVMKGIVKIRMVVSANIVNVRFVTKVIVLNVYAGPDHEQAAQKPEVLKF